MAVAFGDGTNTDTKDIVATMFTDVDCDPCIRVDGKSLSISATTIVSMFTPVTLMANCF